jgi:hypothetical protein
MLLKKIAQNSIRNIEDEKIYYEIIDSHYDKLYPNVKFLEKFSDIKKVIRFYVRYHSYLKKTKENNLEFMRTGSVVRSLFE